MRLFYLLTINQMSYHNWRDENLIPLLRWDSSHSLFHTYVSHRFLYHTPGYPRETYFIRYSRLQQPASEKLFIVQEFY